MAQRPSLIEDATIRVVELSLKELIEADGSRAVVKEIDLIGEKLKLADGSKIETSLEQTWPSFVFLKGLGFKRIHFRQPSDSSLNQWRERVESYQQLYIQDPEYLHIDECIWDEIDPNLDEPVIECVRESTRVEVHKPEAYKVPPMLGPLAIDPAEKEAFIQEIRSHSEADTIRRTLSILKEFRYSSQNFDERLWDDLLLDILGSILEIGDLDRALQLVDDHQNDLRNGWNSTDRIVRVLAAYEPKRAELEKWARVFRSLSLERLISLLDGLLSSPAGPQIIKLMNFRAAQDPEGLIGICLQQNPGIQKILLQWLSPHWKPQHYRQLFEALRTALERGSDKELIQYWIQALFRSYRDQALSDLQSFFRNRAAPKRWLGISNQADLNKQKSILSALEEMPSTDILMFLKEIRSKVYGRNVDYVERLINNYRMQKTDS